MSKSVGDEFIKLTDFDSGKYLYLIPEEIKEIVGLAENKKYAARAKVTTIRRTFLVRENEEMVHVMCMQKCKPEPKPKHKLWSWFEENLFGWPGRG